MSELHQIALKYPTDKATTHNYMPHYQFHFEGMRHERISLLEIGIGGYADSRGGGGSLRMWKEYFTEARIFGFDIAPKFGLDDERIRTWQGDQTDLEFLDRICGDIGDLDIVIDDGSHVPSHVIKTFEFIFPRMSPGGIYVVEDTQTSYWRSMGGDHRGSNNPYTTMNYFKNLADGLNFREFVNPGYVPTYYDLNVVSVHFYHNLIFVHKGDNSEQSNVIVDNIGNSWAF